MRIDIAHIEKMTEKEWGRLQTYVREAVTQGRMTLSQADALIARLRHRRITR